MRSNLGIIDLGDFVSYKDRHYGANAIKTARKCFEQLKNDGIIIGGEFGDDEWKTYPGVRKVGIDFSLDKAGYEKNIGKELGITNDTMKLMLKCYAIYCTGAYIFKTLARDIINVIKTFL